MGTSCDAELQRDSLIRRLVVPLEPLNGRRCECRGVGAAGLDGCRWIPGRSKAALGETLVEKDVSRDGVPVQGLIGDTTANEVQGIDLRPDVDPAAGATLRDHGNGGVNLQVAVSLAIVHLNVTWR